MDPMTLAATVVGSFLVPLLKQGARKLGEALSGAAGEPGSQELVQTADTLLARVEAIFTAPDEREALDAFRKFPDDMQQRLQRLLQQRLESDESLRAELEGLVQKPVGAGASTGAQIMNAQYAAVVDLRGAKVSRANVVGMNVGVPQPQHPQRPPDDGE